MRTPEERMEVEERDAQRCPDALDLLDHSAGRLPAARAAVVAAHLALCAACAARAGSFASGGRIPTSGVPTAPPDQLGAASAGRAERFSALLALKPPADLAFGQLWSTRLPIDERDTSIDELEAEPRLVLVLDPSDPDGGEEGLLVAPISPTRWARAEHDAEVRAEESPVGYRFDVQLWNETPMLRAQLGRYLGQLGSPARRDLGLLYRARWGDDLDPGTARDRVGPAILDERDPRLAAQRAETAALAYLRGPYLRRLGTRLAERATEEVAAGAEAQVAATVPERAWVSGPAVRAARRAVDIQVSRVAALLAEQGFPDRDHHWLARLEQAQESWAIERSLLVALAGILQTSPGRLEGPPAPGFAWPPHLLQRLTSIATRRGESPAVLQEHVERQVLLAVARGTEGQRPDDATIVASLAALLDHLDQ